MHNFIVCIVKKSKTFRHQLHLDLCHFFFMKV